MAPPEFNAPPYFEKAIPAISKCAQGVLFKINLCKNCAAVVDPALTIADLKSEGLDVIDVSATQSKEARANIQTPKFESGRVLLPETAPWLSEFEAELLAFPAGRHDDQVDSIVQALAYEHVEKGGVDYIYLDPPRTYWRNPWR